MVYIKEEVLIAYILKRAFMQMDNLTCLDLGEVFEPKGENLGGKGGIYSIIWFSSIDELANMSV